MDGGIAPATMQMVLTPHVLGGTTHAFEWSVDTTGAANPLTFLSGEFEPLPLQDFTEYLRIQEKLGFMKLVAR